MNIFLVDDHEGYLDSLTNLIVWEIPGCNIVKAYNGIDAIKMLKEFKPDIIFLDYNMPVMNGLETAQHIRKEYPDIKIVMLTNISGKGIILKLIEIADGFLLKTIHGREIKECIERVLTGKKYFCKEAQEIINDQNLM